MKCAAVIVTLKRTAITVVFSKRNCLCLFLLNKTEMQHFTPNDRHTWLLGHLPPLSLHTSLLLLPSFPFLVPLLLFLSSHWLSWFRPSFTARYTHYPVSHPAAWSTFLPRFPRGYTTSIGSNSWNSSCKLNRHIGKWSGASEGSRRYIIPILSNHRFSIIGLGKQIT